MSGYPQLKIKVNPGSTLVIHLLIDSQISEKLLFRPTLDDWVVDNGEVLDMHSSIQPPYLYLYQEKFNQKITVKIPFILPPGKSIKSWLRFPGMVEEAIPISIEIVSPEWGKEQAQTVEVSLPVTLPCTSIGRNLLPAAVDQTTAGCFGLISGVMDLDKLPSRWLAAELLAILCEKGEEYAQRESGAELLARLKTTAWFKNRAIAFASAQIPNWIADSLKTTNIIFGGHSLVNIWEQWLLSLAPGTKAEVFIAKQERYAENWLAGILLGIGQINPRIGNKLKEIAAGESLNGESANNFIFALPDLDKLPARWLVVELLLILCIQGDKYGQTKAGRALLAQLNQTDFFNNGVLAFAAAQVPRWLTITHQAASAYHASVGTKIGQGGLLPMAEQWLLGEMKSEISVCGATADAFVESMGMDAKRWFSCVVLGLGVVSPRMGGVLGAIASDQSTTPLPSPTPSQQTKKGNLFPEGGSLQR
ncbi:hypothetical protein [Microseira wollei]|uniref:DUF2877 domain-containing protein n=1 Tax=Microseira wollei NIES-4236 TaxID=2530354 RepID=A0AAV3XHX1_9CYAN|nr:hypothetical protein [Microseira wollei]GET41143.1 hypothetical protein MiSe_59550 [Microseira wollei NIES-4236]